MTEDLNAHLADIIKDVERVRKAINEDEAPHRLTGDEVKCKLSDISNALDDLYNSIVGL